jgi:SAM-dependent methyltransferase
MKNKILPILLLAACLAAGWSLWQRDESPSLIAPTTQIDPTASAGATPVSPYRLGTASADGIGKFFHGREIAQVMGHPAIDWLERENREDEEAPTRALESLGLAADAVIADIGAGSGYYSFRLAPKIPHGQVVAVDIQLEMIDFLKQRAAELKITNVKPHLGSITSLELPAGSLDAALLVDSYHEFSHPAEMLSSLFHSLKPGGRVFLLEYRGEDAQVPIKELHKMTEAQARAELEASGFRFVVNHQELPWQHFMVFERPLFAWF